MSLPLPSAYRVYIKGNKNWYTGKVIAYGGYFYFAQDAAVNFLERELGMKRGVCGMQHLLIISIHGCQIRKKSVLTELCEIIDWYITT